MGTEAVPTISFMLKVMLCLDPHRYSLDYPCNLAVFMMQEVSCLLSHLMPYCQLSTLI
jgi:hypothetical protein